MRPALDGPASPYCEELSPEQLQRIDADVMLLLGAAAASSSRTASIDNSTRFDATPRSRSTTTWPTPSTPPRPLAIPAFIEYVVPHLAVVVG